MAVGRREIYEAGRADERSEIVAFLRDHMGSPSMVIGPLVDAIERGEHAEAVVLGAEVGG